MALFRRLRHFPTKRPLYYDADYYLERLSPPFVCSKFSFPNISRQNSHSNLKMTKSRTYQDAISALNSLQSNAQTLERARKTRDVNASKNISWMEKLLLIMGVKTEDLDSLNVIHVSGTKGKGSTCAFTESLLRTMGYSTGFFSSPHLVAVRERIRLAGKPISETLFASYFWEVFDKLTEECQSDGMMPPYFKFLTVMSYYIFLKEQVDVAIVEVGIGGAYDSTNVVRNPVVCGVSSLGYDHMSLLGQTLPEISWHKAGIFKSGCPAITVSQPAEAMDVLSKQAEKIGAPLYLAPNFSDYPTETGTVKLGLNGVVQGLNASLALQLCKMWISRRSIQSPVSSGTDESPVPLPAFSIKPILAEALETCKWPGRFQHVKLKSVDFYLDGAHTRESVRHCANWFKTTTQPAAGQQILLFNSTADRRPEDLLQPLVECSFDYAVFCPNNIGQSVNGASDLANFTVNPEQQMARCLMQETVWRNLTGERGATRCFQNVAEAFRWIERQGNENRGGEGVEVLVTGSLHLVGAMLTLLDPTLEESL